MPSGIGYSSTLRTASRAAVAKAQVSESQGGDPSLTPPVTSPFVAYLQAIWDRNRRGREEVTAKMLENLRSYRNEYDGAKLAAIKQEGGSDVFMGLTRTKCRHGISWLMDIFTSAEKPWSLEPSPKPDASGMAKAKVMQIIAKQVQKQTAEAQEEGGGQVTPELIQEIQKAVQPMAEEALDIELKDRARRMDRTVHDQLLEGGFFKEFRQFIRDLVILKAGILKGPIPRKVDKFQWEQQGDGTFKRIKQTEIRPHWVRVSPFDLYPDPQASDIENGPIVERMELQRAELSKLKTEKGYRKDAINRILLDFNKYANAFDSEEPNDTARATLEEKEQTTEGRKSEDCVTAKEFTLSVPGTKLAEYEGDELLSSIPGAPSKIEKTESYDVNVILVENEVIFFKFDKDPVDKVRYYKYGWDEVNGSFWYEGVPETMSDLQKICNASARALVNNMGVASGPMAEIDVDRLLPGESIEGIKPFRIFQTTGNGRGNSKAINFFQPSTNSESLLKVYDSFAKLADEYTGIPAYSYGNDRVAGAGRTSSGLSMLMSAAARGIKDVILGMDDNVIKPLVQAAVDWNMKYSDDETIKGDLQVVSTGAVALMVREQMADRRMSFLKDTLNDTDMELMGTEGRANVLREVARSLELSSAQIVKDPEEVRQMVESAEESRRQEAEQAAQMAQREAEVRIQQIEADIQAKQLQAQVSMMQVELEKMKIQLAQQKAQADAQLKARGQDLEAQNRREERDLNSRKFAVEEDRKRNESRSKIAKESMEGLATATNMIAGATLPEDDIAADDDTDASLLEQEQSNAI